MSGDLYFFSLSMGSHDSSKYGIYIFRYLINFLLKICYTICKPRLISMCAYIKIIINFIELYVFWPKIWDLKFS